MKERIWHALKVDETFEALGSGPKGLTGDEARVRLASHGPNVIADEAGPSPWAIIKAQILNPLVAILAVAAIVSLAIGHHADAIVIGVVVLVNTVIGFSQEYKAEHAIEQLRSRAAPKARVLRRPGQSDEAVEVEVETANLVPGDLLALEAGDKVPADARLTFASNLEVDESMLTGESTTVTKQLDPVSAKAGVGDRSNLVYAGTAVTRGRARAVVYGTGANTEVGKIATLLQETEKAHGPLQEQLASLGKTLGILAIAWSALTFGVGVLRGFGVPNMLGIALASAVSAIPEGLPAVMTVTLAVGVNRMAKRNAIIRRLMAVDTLGAATVICTDKTGTLTTNEMTVQALCFCGREVEVSGAGYAVEGGFSEDGEAVEPSADEQLALALQIGTLCNNASLVTDEHSGGAQGVRGDPTEGALIVAAAKAGLDKVQLDAEHPRVDEIPFESSSGYMATFHRQNGDAARVYVKGAPERVVDRCTSVSINGEIKPLDGELRQKIAAANEELAGQAMRVLALAYRELADDAELEEAKQELDKGQGDLVFVALTGMMDPPRPEAATAVSDCRRAGIRVVMATGDHRATGEAIAREIGIAGPDDLVVTGAELEEMSDEALDQMIGRVAVFARVSPEHKHRIVGSLRRRGHVVAMTGDGINDAPALRLAEIGVSMGITGTDVTKESADMVLTDDNFASIVHAVEEGRTVFANVRKVVKFLIATNVGEMLTILASLLIVPNGVMILTPVQILWVNLVTDGILDITLAMEPGEAGVMDDPPRDRHARIINNEILRGVVLVAAFMAAGTLVPFLANLSARGVAYAQTMAFTTLAMFQVFNSLNCRSRTRSIFQMPVLSNPWLLGAIIVSVLLQIAANRLPFLQQVFGTEALTLRDWLMIVAIAATVVVADEIRKVFSRKKAAARAEAAKA